jgi:NAD-dependent dihydropyrimidine dehydrogenase PreA subunit
MSKKWYPVINFETCIECGRCIHMCCHGVYDKTLKKPTVVHPDGCVEGCHGCGNKCPTHSIEYVGEINGKQEACGCGESCECHCKEE